MLGEKSKPEVAITKDDFDLLLRQHQKLEKNVANLWGMLLNHYKYEQKYGHNYNEFNSFVHQLDKLM